MSYYYNKRTCVDPETPLDDFVAEFPELRKHMTDTKDPWRGPHEGRSYNLMMRGKKPMVLTEETHWEYDAFKPLIKSGALVVVFIKKNADHFTGDSIAVCLSSQVWRGHKLREIYKNFDTQDLTMIDHAKIGILLGYSNYEIRMFLNTLKPEKQKRARQYV